MAITAKNGMTMHKMRLMAILSSSVQRLQQHRLPQPHQPAQQQRPRPALQER